MFRFIIRSILFALLFTLIFPKIDAGVQFHAQTTAEVIVWSLTFTAVATLVSYVAIAILLFFVFGTLGLGIFILYPIKFLIPFALAVLQLAAFAHFFPNQFTVSSFGAALIGGLFIWAINFITTKRGSVGVKVTTSSAANSEE